MIPNPSHPSKRNIVCGNKIRIIIDVTNIKTKIMNRSENLSFIMYVLANCITLEAISKTVVINRVLAGSSKIGIFSEELDIFTISHSIIILFIEKIVYIVIIKEITVSVDRILVAKYTMVRITGESMMPQIIILFKLFLRNGQILPILGPKPGVNIPSITDGHQRIALVINRKYTFELNRCRIRI